MPRRNDRTFRPSNEALRAQRKVRDAMATYMDEPTFANMFRMHDLDASHQGIVRREAQAQGLLQDFRLDGLGRILGRRGSRR